MKAKLIPSGESLLLRILRPLIEEACLTDEVELPLQGGSILIASDRQPRVGWAEAAKRMHERGDDALVGDSSGNDLDRGEWTW